MSERRAVTAQHPGEELLTDLALGDVDPTTEEVVLRHLRTCAACREEYQGLEDGVRQVLLAAPAAAAPPGLVDGVLAAARRVRRPRRSARMSAVAAVAGLLLGAGVTALLLDRAGEPGGQVAAIGPALVTVDGERVGTVLQSWYGGRPVLVVTLTDGTPGARYECVLVFPDGAREPAGSWEVAQPAGATWVVAADEGAPAPDRVELVHDSGATWATASL